MKTIVLFLSLMVCMGKSAYAQENTTVDSNFIQSIPQPTYLPEFDYNIIQFDSFNYGGWYLPQPDPFPYPWTGNFTIILAPYAMCGEARYDNGRLYSRCECNADSVRHGKSVFWEINGKINSVQYYSNGKIYTTKNYFNGKVAWLENYAYRNNEQLIHGKRIEYLEYGKLISHYHFGKKHGEEVEYMDGYLYSKKQYKNDVLIDEKTFDQQGRTLSEATWNEQGIPTGTWVHIRPESNGTQYTTYENGQKRAFRSMIGDVCIELQKYSDAGVLIHSESNFADGSPRQYFDIDSTQTKITKEWSKKGELISNWRVHQNKLIGKGFISDGQKCTHYQQILNPDGTDYLECWSFNYNDTTSFFYAYNRGGRFTDIIYENKFVQHNGKAVKHGKWTLYQNNQVVLEENFNFGILHGEWKQYAEVEGKYQVQLEGTYDLGMRTDYWKVNTDSCEYHVLYTNDTMAGKMLVYEQSTLSAEIMYNHLWDESNRIFNLKEGKSTKWNCRYLDEIPHGKWHEFHEDGTLKGYGVFENGKLKSKWIELIPKKNGKMKKVRLKDKVLPSPVFPEISELYSVTPV